MDSWIKQEYTDGEDSMSSAECQVCECPKCGHRHVPQQQASQETEEPIIVKHEASDSESDASAESESDREARRRNFWGGEKWDYFCPVEDCEQRKSTFSRADNLISHLRRSHKLQSEYIDKVVADDANRKRVLWECPVEECLEYQYGSLRKLKKHLKLVHGIRGEAATVEHEASEHNHVVDRMISDGLGVDEHTQRPSSTSSSLIPGPTHNVPQISSAQAQWRAEVREAQIRRAKEAWEYVCPVEGCQATPLLSTRQPCVASIQGSQTRETVYR